MQTKNLVDAITKMPKVELHVHLKGATRPETILKLAAKNNVDLPAKTLEEMREWFKFKNFNHFLDVYMQAGECYVHPEDIELAAREFLAEQARQNIVYTELTYTAKHNGLPFEEQLGALNSAKAWGEKTLGVTMNYIIDIPRSMTYGDHLERAKLYAKQAVSGMGRGVVALGLAGDENKYTVEFFKPAFDIANEAGLPIVPHAGEAAGPPSMFDAIEFCNPPRIGHGVRCIEDEKLMALLHERQIHLEISPTSNICLGIFDSMDNHSFPQIAAADIPYSINSDDPPYFNTTLTDELIMVAERLNWSDADMQAHMHKTAEVTLLPATQKAELLNRLT